MTKPQNTTVASQALGGNHKKVIPSSEPPRWTVLDYGNQSGSLIQKWYDDLSLQGQATFDALVKANRTIADPAQWVGNRGHLKGKAAAEGIFELGFKADKRQYRLFCVTQPGRVLVLLLACYHKQENYTPTDAIATGTRRAKEVESGKAIVYAREDDTSI